MMALHGSAAARDEGEGVLLVGAPGAGKSDLLLRLIDRGFQLVADDQVLIDNYFASAPAELAGILEIRGLGLARMPYMTRARLRLVVRLGCMDRLPVPSRYDIVDLPMVTLDPRAASAPLLVGLALDAALGRQGFAAGAFG